MRFNAEITKIAETVLKKGSALPAHSSLEMLLFAMIRVIRGKEVLVARFA